jgi:hypothetical protein
MQYQYVLRRRRRRDGWTDEDAQENAENCKADTCRKTAGVIP